MKVNPRDFDGHYAEPMKAKHIVEVLSRLVVEREPENTHIPEWSDLDLVWYKDDEIIHWQHNATPPEVGQIAFTPNRNGWRMKYVVTEVTAERGHWAITVEYSK